MIIPSLCYSFNVSGHKNIRGTHRNTFEFTKDPGVSPRGDCIVGVKATFDKQGLIGFLRRAKQANAEKVRLLISVKTDSEIIEDEIIAVPNLDYSEDHSFVVRLSHFASSRTFATQASKSAMMLKREIIESMKSERACAVVTIYIINS